MTKDEVKKEEQAFQTYGAKYVTGWGLRNTFEPGILGAGLFLGLRWPGARPPKCASASTARLSASRHTYATT